MTNPAPGGGDVGRELGERLRRGDLSAAPAVLNLLESTATADRAQAAELLAAVSPAALGGEAAGHVVGVTGPPGVGKSTLVSALVAIWRADGRSVAALVVDPSSKRSGGALLGDRVRIAFDPSDRGVFVRSTATAQRLGGVARATRAAAQALAAAFDIVVVETVGVGQSETEVADVADTVAVVLQPGSGDTLQFLKSGIMEIPDILVVTKGDTGRQAKDTFADAGAALTSVGSTDTPLLLVSAVSPPAGVDALAAAIDAHAASIDRATRRQRARLAGALVDYVTEHGEHGLRRLGGRRQAEAVLVEQAPGLDVAGLVAFLEERAGLAADEPGCALGRQPQADL
ncbi:MAG TPA: ArgK protein [Solirubrobacteraceae bacterium]|nr:ArgK protein [Solirubrobacteraceae bacterium]